jgi:branched-chain amino acid transport system substrate-binding protein
LQAAAIVQAIDRTGAKSMALTYPDDEYGRRLGDSVQQHAARAGLRVVTAIAYDQNNREYRDLAARLFSATPPEALALIGSASVGAKVLSTLRTNGGAQTPIFVNDAMRGAGAVLSKPGASVNWLDRVHGVAALSEPSNPSWAKRYEESTRGAPPTFAAYAYDCVVLIALGALASSSEVPARLAGSVISVSRGGAPCTSFVACRDLIRQGLNIDYVGTSGALDLDDYGDVSSGSFEQFSFDAAGRDVLSPVKLSV